MTNNNLNWSLEYYEEHTSECNAILDSLEDYEQIPLINSISVHNLVDGTLVRYRGMIQDMLNPEYYSESYTVVNRQNNETYVRSGKFRDISSCKPNEELRLNEIDFVPKQRLVFFCIPKPGLNNWVLDLQKPCTLTAQNEGHSSGLKRHADDEDSTMDPRESLSQSDMKRNKVSVSRTDTNSQNETCDSSKYFPIPTNNDVPCLIKIYEDEEDSKIILNDVIEVVGFLSVNPALEANWEDADIEDKALHPPPSLVPRLHALRIRKPRHSNPLLKQIISFDDIKQLAESARSDLHLVLTQLFFDDTLAADYMICHLISAIYIRNETHVIGKFSLNLSNIKLTNFAEDFYEIFKSFVTSSHYIPLSTNLLNETSFVPKKDYETNRLRSGMLQLCDGVHLIFDETKMNEGQLNSTGCLNVAALQRLFREQEVLYDFWHYSVKYETNIPLLVISEGNSMFQVDIRVKVKPELCTEANFMESLQAVRLYLNNNVLNKIRIYLTSVKLLDFDLSKEMMERIADDFVSMRREDQQIDSSDLHMLIVLSRLLVLSHGRTSLTPEDWAKAIDMETERKSRLV